VTRARSALPPDQATRVLNLAANRLDSTVARFVGPAAAVAHAGGAAEAPGPLAPPPGAREGGSLTRLKSFIEKRGKRGKGLRLPRFPVAGGIQKRRALARPAGKGRRRALTPLQAQAAAAAGVVVGRMRTWGAQGRAAMVADGVDAAL
jgi:hypothetical protein